MLTSPIFTSYDLLPKVLRLLSRCPSVKTVIYIESKIQSNHYLINDNVKYPESFNVLPLSRVEQDGSTQERNIQLDHFDIENIIHQGN